MLQLCHPGNLLIKNPMQYFLLYACVLVYTITIRLIYLKDKIRHIDKCDHQWLHTGFFSSH